MLNRPRRRQDNAINAGSMADIAFLLLIFFLVTTTILEDSGIFVGLPPLDNDSLIEDIPDRNILTVKINAENQLLVENELATIDHLKASAKEFILNPRRLTTLPSSPKKAIISMQNDRGTSYDTYIAVYNEIKAAYNELWDEAARERFGKAYEKLSAQAKKEVRREIPLIISEAEPTEHGKE